MASELTIRYQSDSGFSCEKYDNLPAPQSVYIGICFTANQESEKLANELKDKLVTAIENLESNFQKIAPPCSGFPVRTFNRCNDLYIKDSIKLLIVVSNGQISTFANNDVLTFNHTILPVLPYNIPVTLPPPFDKPQAVRWSSNIEEVIPAIFGLIGVSDEDMRIFISYRQKETSPLADQLFEGLTKQGFEVFLDKYSINPSVLFQNRLYQELADKAMVIFLESDSFLESSWVQLEIDFAKTNELGRLALNIKNAPETPSIDEEDRIKFSSTDFTADEKLLEPQITQLISEIKRRHSVALYFRKHYLNENVAEALRAKGVTEEYDSYGFIHDGVKDYRIWTTPRPPKINDYHYTDLSCTASRKIIFGPKFIEDKRRLLSEWLTDKSSIEFYNEGQLLELVDSL